MLTHKRTTSYSSVYCPAWRHYTTTYWVLFHEANFCSSRTKFNPLTLTLTLEGRTKIKLNVGFAEENKHMSSQNIYPLEYSTRIHVVYSI